MAKYQHPIREAERYLANARQILSEKAEKDGDIYNDDKYVRMAGNTAWNGVLIALDASLGIRKGLKRNQRPDISDYQRAMSMRDQRMSKILHGAYETVHKSMGYDGNPAYGVVQTGMSFANDLVKWADKNYYPTPEEIAAWNKKPNFLQRIYSLFFSLTV